MTNKRISVANGVALVSRIKYRALFEPPATAMSADRGKLWEFALHFETVTGARLINIETIPA